VRWIGHKPQLALHIITMYRDDDLAKLLSSCQHYFDIMRVCDGSGEVSTKAICKQYDTEYYYRSWDDNYHLQDNVLLKQARPGDWVFIMDDDEIPSQPLLENMRTLIRRAKVLNCNIISLPCLLVLDDKSECGLEEFIEETRIGKRHPFRKFWLFEYDKSVLSYGTPHRLVESERGWSVFDQPFPYYHYKTKRGFILNDCVHAFINQADQGYTVTEARELRVALAATAWKTSRDVISCLETGNVPDALLKFAWKYKDQTNRSISRWFWSYYFLIHPDKLPEGFSHEDISYKAYQEYCHH